MKRWIVLCVAVVLLPAMSWLALAGPGGQQPRKKSMNGTIEQINVKQHVITVKATAAAQQIQTQGDVAQKPKTPDTLTFSVDANTKIAIKGGQQKGGITSLGAQSPLQIGLLKAGQLVRVVYEEVAAPCTSQNPVKKPSCEQKPEQSVKPAQNPAPVQTQQVSPVPVKKTKGAATPVQGKLPKTLRAVSIEILVQGPAQQTPAVPAVP